jgi:vacuolar protein sorting-associated protein 13A/C
LSNRLSLDQSIDAFVDIFYEPYEGVMLHGSKEIGIGIARGAGSFLKKTVFGVTDSLAKFTGSVGKGLSVATFDKDFEGKRRMRQYRNKPKVMVRFRYSLNN